MSKHVAGILGRTLTAGAASLLLLGGCATVVSPDEGPLHEQDLPRAPTPGGPQLPAVSGGTLLITKSNATAVAADPDRDKVWLVDLIGKVVRKSVPLAAGSEPGRIVEDADGQVHIALRRGGQVMKLDPQTGAVVEIRPVCAAPRGLAYDATTDNLHVACAGGELVTWKARGGDILRRLYLDRDLRDVVVKGDHLLVSRFRSAELLDVDASGAVVKRVQPRAVGNPNQYDGFGRPMTASPTVAWRLLAMPGDETLMLHQRAQDSTISTKPGGYTGGTCMIGGVVTTGMTTYQGTMAGNTVPNAGAIPMATVMTVDAAVSPDGQQIALISTTQSAPLMMPSPFQMQPVTVYHRAMLQPGSDTCVPPLPPTMPPIESPVQYTAGAFDGMGKLYVQGRTPAQIRDMTTQQVILLDPATEPVSEGHRLFHTPTTGMMACASCHPEGGDDSHVWTFTEIGTRRTQSLRGGILATAPFHWDGDMNNLSTLMNQVFTGRMSGPSLSPTQIDQMGAWLDGQPRLPASAPRQADAVARGKILFNDSVVGCASCHSGTHFTNNQSANVGTGKAFQVPTLVDLAARAPYLHTGCANTLRDRFNPGCGGGDSHGRTSHLQPAQLDDLSAYLETL